MLGESIIYTPLFIVGLFYLYICCFYTTILIIVNLVSSSKCTMSSLNVNYGLPMYLKL